MPGSCVSSAATEAAPPAAQGAVRVTDRAAGTRRLLARGRLPGLLRCLAPVCRPRALRIWCGRQQRLEHLRPACARPAAAHRNRPRHGGGSALQQARVHLRKSVQLQAACWNTAERGTPSASQQPTCPSCERTDGEADLKMLEIPNAPPGLRGPPARRRPPLPRAGRLPAQPTCGTQRLMYRGCLDTLRRCTSDFVVCGNASVRFPPPPPERIVAATGSAVAAACGRLFCHQRSADKPPLRSTFGSGGASTRLQTPSSARVHVRPLWFTVWALAKPAGDRSACRKLAEARIPIVVKGRLETDSLVTCF